MTHDYFRVKMYGKEIKNKNGTQTKEAEKWIGSFVNRYVNFNTSW